jgi:hypothetical protein
MNFVHTLYTILSIRCTQTFHMIITISNNYFTKQYEPNKTSNSDYVFCEEGNPFLSMLQDENLTLNNAQEIQIHKTMNNEAIKL